MPSIVKTIRFDESEITMALRKGKTYGLTDFSAIIRLALRRLRNKREGNEADS